MIDKITAFETRLKIKEDSEYYDKQLLKTTVYVVTEFPRTLEGEMKFVLNVPQDLDGNGNIGFMHSMFSKVVTKEELEEHFEIIKGDD